MVNFAGLAMISGARVALSFESRMSQSKSFEISRRDFLTTSSLSLFGLALDSPISFAAEPDHTHEWDWLIGNWDVWHRRLKDRLVGSDEWQEFGGKSALWLSLGGLGTIDDNIVDLPGNSYRGLTLRAFDPTTQTWAIWWLDGRNPTHIDPPVMGRFEGESGTFIGRDTFKGIPILMRFRWNELHSKRPWWEQAFSTDEGAHWEVNWRNYFTLTSKETTPLPVLADAPKDWDFLVGRWNVRHRKLAQRFVSSKQWQTFNGTLVNWPVLGGHGNVGDNAMNFPDGIRRGVSCRSFDPATREWLIWWLDGRTPSTISTPLRGSFANGVGTFVGEEEMDGREVKTRVRWSVADANAPRWEQSSSVDGGHTWESNWISEFTRQA
ncbi:MAG: hypothetical protein ACJ8OJ_10080 [Povalibacter sp.]